MNSLAEVPGRSEPASVCETAFGAPRDCLESRFVYTVVSPRAHGLSVGINLNPDKRCNFDCVYCEVNRSIAAPETRLDVPVMIAELEQALTLVCSGRIRERTLYRNTPAKLLELGHVALSGDGEPTLCPNFGEVVESVVHLRAQGGFPFFKLVLITNATGLDRPDVAEGLKLFTSRDDIWAKLEAGTQDYMNRINRPDCTLEKVMSNILALARHRPVIIQSLFPAICGAGPSSSEIEAYVRRLNELKDAGAQIQLVQIFSATRPTLNPDCRHLPLRSLSSIAQRVREATGLRADVV